MLCGLPFVTLNYPKVYIISEKLSQPDNATPFFFFLTFPSFFSYLFLPPTTTEELSNRHRHLHHRRRRHRTLVVATLPSTSKPKVAAEPFSDSSIGFGFGGGSR